MRAILIPVKLFANAKQRLAAHFSPVQWAGLAAALCEDFFCVAAAVRGIDAIFVTSAEPLALEWAEKYGFACLAESAQVSESHSVDAASLICATRGVRALLRLPVDIPLAVPTDIEAIFQALETAPACVIVPSRDGTGTNALLRAPPSLFPSSFGADSLARHIRAAELCGARVTILANANIGLDIDEREDLEALTGRLEPGSATARWFAATINSGRDPIPPGG